MDTDLSEVVAVLNELVKVTKNSQVDNQEYQAKVLKALQDQSEALYNINGWLEGTRQELENMGRYLSDLANRLAPQEDDRWPG